MSFDYCVVCGEPVNAYYGNACLECGERQHDFELAQKSARYNDVEDYGCFPDVLDDWGD
jgi:hypothetical protein